ncbi:MAG: hypothetical protein COA91_08850 [Robiginitomaculum sp.]|nr:MAG: hypothetical protein COA91_08850 [Robiginitomaculum sp.]
MRVLLTGATGFIGKKIAKNLHTSADVFVVVRDKSAAPALDLSEFCTLIQDDIAQELSLDKYPKKIDAVIHCAQSMAYQTFPKNALDVFRVNVTATAQLLDYALNAGAGSFCHISSGSIYEPYGHILHEDCTLTPHSVNGCSKAAAEMLVGSYAALMKTCSLRLFMPYGPGQTNRLLPSLIDKVLLSKTITLAQGTGPIIAPIHVEDVANTIAEACKNQWQGIVNIAGTQTMSLSDVVTAISENLKQDLNIKTTSEDPVNLAPPLDVLKSKMPTDSFINFKTGLSDTINAFLLENPIRG